MVVSSFAIGALAVPIFYLGFVDALLTIFFINILGIFPVCFFSTFGPRFGLRQMVLSRYFYGYYGVKLSMSPSIPSLHKALNPRQADRSQSPSSMSSHASDGRPSMSLWALRSSMP